MKIKIPIEPTGEEPPSKIRHLDEAAVDQIDILPILPADLTSVEVPLAQFHVLNLENKKLIGRLLKLLPEIQGEFSHLKRVDKCGRILIGPATTSTVSEGAREALEKLDLNAEQIEIADVPRIKPNTRRQFDWAKERWPTAFHPNQEVESLLDQSYFTRSFREYVRKWSKEAEKVGCIVVQREEELARGSLSSRLLGHPAMNMVSNLSRKERQGTEYLATDCDVFIRDEPCAMCAMGLVHARAARIFFLRKSMNGVLSEGGWQLHLDPSINHHYKVFQVKLDPDSDSATTLKCGSIT